MHLVVYWLVFGSWHIQHYTPHSKNAHYTLKWSEMKYFVCKFFQTAYLNGALCLIWLVCLFVQRWSRKKNSIVVLILTTQYITIQPYRLIWNHFLLGLCGSKCRRSFFSTMIPNYWIQSINSPHVIDSCTMNGYWIHFGFLAINNECRLRPLNWTSEWKEIIHIVAEKNSSIRISFVLYLFLSLPLMPLRRDRYRYFVAQRNLCKVYVHFLQCLHTLIGGDHFRQVLFKYCCNASQSPLV